MIAYHPDTTCNIVRVGNLEIKESDESKFLILERKILCNIFGQ